MSESERGAVPVKLIFQDWLDVQDAPVRSRSFECSSGGVQLRVGAVWLDAAEREPLEDHAWPTPDYRVTLVHAATPERRLDAVRVSLEDNAKLRWRDLPPGDYCIEFASANRDARYVLYVEFSVAAFVGVGP